MRDKILIVDDVDINRLILAEILNNDYDILEAGSGQQALSVIEQCDPLPKAILLDIIMPGMDGFEVLERLKSNPRTTKIPVLFITAADAEETETRGLNAGAADYISKPFNPDVVKARVHNHIQLFNYSEDLENMVTRKTADLVKTHEQMLEIMASIIEYRSLESGMHIHRTSELTKILIRKMETMPQFIRELKELNADSIGKAVVLHDIGKVGIPDNILLKPGKLTPEEFEVIKTHTVIGSTIIDRISSELTEDTVYLARCREICRSHHEYWNGKGYPDALSGTAIPLSARILSIVDVYEALVAERCYKKAMHPDQAARIICECSGTQFDPDIYKAFVAVEEEFKNFIFATDKARLEMDPDNNPEPAQ